MLSGTEVKTVIATAKISPRRLDGAIMGHVSAISSSVPRQGPYHLNFPLIGQSVPQSPLKTPFSYIKYQYAATHPAALSSFIALFSPVCHDKSRALHQ